MQNVLIDFYDANLCVFKLIKWIVSGNARAYFKALILLFASDLYENGKQINENG